jgi:hypothetical protein
MTNCKTELGQFRELTSDDGRKNFDTDVKNELTETIETIEED